jgi:hypothetical protein
MANLWHQFIDSGAADVSVPADIVSTLIRTKTVSEQEFLGVQTYVLVIAKDIPPFKRVITVPYCHLRDMADFRPVDMSGANIIATDRPPSGREMEGDVTK